MARNSRVEEDLVDQLFNSSEKRLARFAADIVNRVLPDDPAAEAAVNRKAQALGIDIGQENWAEVCLLSLGLLIC